ncbi:MAG: PQQ-binding-like beta-propeller repeat protein [Verrucomicrobiales bacterium]|nr:PQQ-binding-like beta-propeller repeat protein [Verrucomicrobiales bacterium]
MKLVIPSLSLLFLAATATAGDWPVWRGPNGNGHAAEGEKPPTVWAQKKNVLWMVEIPGRGHSSPILIGDKILLTTADESSQSQSVLCLSRADGSEIWTKEINRGGFEKKIHQKNTHASPTLGSNGESVFGVFNNNGSVQVFALDLDGNKLWSKNVGAFRGRYPFGYAPSPLLHDGKVIVASEFEKDGYIVALDQKSGDEIWRISRPGSTSYSSPIVANVSGKEQLLISGQEKVSSFDPETGKNLWSVAGTTHATCGTLVWNDDTVFASGGYPDKETIAVKADGSGKVLWRNKDKSYEQSLLVVGGHVYTLNDGGIAICWDAKTGEEKWKERLGGPVSSSPIYAGGHIYATNERGITFVFKPNPERYEEVAKNQLGDEGFPTPVFVDDKIYIRTATHSGGGRQEWLVCIGQE